MQGQRRLHQRTPRPPVRHPESVAHPHALEVSNCKRYRYLNPKLFTATALPVANCRFLTRFQRLLTPARGSLRMWQILATRLSKSTISP